MKKTNDNKIAQLADELATLLEGKEGFERSELYRICGLIAPENFDENAIS